jgi:hypothetical protein
MALLVTGILVGAIVLIGHSAYGLAACALLAAAFALWWDGQPSRPLDHDR